MKLYIALQTILDIEAIPSLLSGNSDITHIAKNHYKPLGINQITNYLESYKTLDTNKQELFYTDKPLKSAIKGLYFGNDTCEHLLITPIEIKKAIAYCATKKWHIVFRLPPMSENYTERYKEILEMLDSYGLEVVFNDFGALELASNYPNIKKTLGRLFFKSQRSGFLDTFIQHDVSGEVFKAQIQNTTHCEYELQSIREFYKSLGIKRVSLENLPIKTEWLKQKPYMNVDIYYPNLFLAKSRVCESAGVLSPKAAYHPQSFCAKPCKEFILEYDMSRYSGVFADLNAYYKTKTKIEFEKTVMKQSDARLVWEMI
ncbi:MAG: hypothetical protein PHE67_04940 [Campylobacterales bacterium]|nr:hypothetical protein [Campylobacterales bacterium]